MCKNMKNKLLILSATGQVAVVVFEAESRNNTIEGGFIRRAGDGNVMLNFSNATNNRMEGVVVNSLINSTLFTVSMTDADKTLEEFQAQSGFVEITGITTTTRILYIPLVNRELYIKNSTNGTLEVRLRGQVTTGVDLLTTNSKKYLVEIGKTSNNWISN